MKKIFFILLLLGTKSISNAQITVIPDYRFEQALIDLDIDSDQTINGQIFTNDALLVIELNLSTDTLENYPYPGVEWSDGMIHDLTGIEAFVNLEVVVMHTTMVDNLNLNNLSQLRYLDCADNNLTSINVSNNPLLEHINIRSEGDLLPINNINFIDLSNNPVIATVIAPGVDKINLNNNNNSQNIFINFGCTYCAGKPIDFIVGTVCIGVDNVELAENNQPPYSEWVVSHAHRNINYSDDLNQCALGVTTCKRENIRIYPNPLPSDLLYLNSDSIISKIIIFDLMGRKIIEYKDVKGSLEIPSIQKGNYVLKIITDHGEQTEKLIVE